MALGYPPRNILDRLVRQPFPKKDAVPAMIGVAEFGYRSAEDRAGRCCVLSLSRAYVHRSLSTPMSADFGSERKMMAQTASFSTVFLTSAPSDLGGKGHVCFEVRNGENQPSTCGTSRRLGGWERPLRPCPGNRRNGRIRQRRAQLYGSTTLTSWTAARCWLQRRR